MKYIIKVISLLILLLILAINNPIKATSNYDIEVMSDVIVAGPGQQIEIKIKVKDISNIPGGVAGLSAKLEYDTTKLEKIGEGINLNGFALVEGDLIVLAKYPGVTIDTEVAKFIFRVKNNASGEIQIKLSDIEVANGEENFQLGRDVIKTIPILALDNPTGELSSNNNLSSISIDGITISNFNKDTLEYTLAPVENSKTKINIAAEVEDSKANITGIGEQNLTVGTNSFSIVVTAEDGTQKTYKINVERKGTTIKEENTDANKKPEKEPEKENDTGSTEKLPQTGVESYTLYGMIIIAVIVAIISLKKLRKLSGV